MRYSVTLVASDRTLPVAELAVLVEERGFDGLWLPDHTHVPVNRPAVEPSAGTEIPVRHVRMLDPLVGLAMAAAVTSRISLGTGVLLVAQRDPIVTAKALASIDHQSGGRLVVGVGYGWNVDELRDHGVDPASRRARSREHVLVMRRLWEHDVAEFAGDHVVLAPSSAWPKPAQPSMPILVGAAPSPVSFRHIAEFGHGWIPVGGRGVAAAVPDLRRAFELAGRDPDELQVVPFSSGDADHEKADHLARAGATEIAFDLDHSEPDAMVDGLDRLAEFVAARRRRDR